MSEEPLKPEEQKLREQAARAFAHHAAEAKAPGGRVRSIWARRVEPWVLTIAVVLFLGWALARVFLSR